MKRKRTKKPVIIKAVKADELTCASVGWKDKMRTSLVKWTRKSTHWHG